MDNGVSALSLCMSTCCTVGGFRVPGFVFMMVIANLGVTPSSAALTGLPIVSAPSAACLWGGGRLSCRRPPFQGRSSVYISLGMVYFCFGLHIEGSRSLLLARI